MSTTDDLVGGSSIIVQKGSYRRLNRMDLLIPIYRHLFQQKDSRRAGAKYQLPESNDVLLKVLIFV